MAKASSLLSEDQFLCSICLDVFTDPVTIPCGHNFCKSCISENWDRNAQCRCPVCADLFDSRPKLSVNIFIREMAAQFRRCAQEKTGSSSSEERRWRTGEVLCDVCTETREKALKSCLVCLTSYCGTHLEPHHRVAGLKRHDLIDPVDNLEDRTCRKHHRPLALFCKTDQTCVCQFCTERDHRTHEMVPLEEEYEEKKVELGKTGAAVQQEIQERRAKIEQIQESVRFSKEDTERDTADCVQVLGALIESMSRAMAQRIGEFEEKQKTTEKQAEGFIKELQEEISELTKRCSELEELSQSEDPLSFLHIFPTLNPTPPTKDWTEVVVCSKRVGTLRGALARLEGELGKDIKKLCADAELKRVQQYAVDVTLDPDTASPYLILSDDEKQVSHCDMKQNLPENLERFSNSTLVLGKQSFHSGRFYYEVQVKGKTGWNLGVAIEPINRKSNTPFSRNGRWSVRLCSGNEYSMAFGNVLVSLSLKSRPQKVGVFVDYTEGLVSFYDVDAAALIHSFEGCKFAGKRLHPYFSPHNNEGGKNAAPLTICPINHVG